MKLLSKILTTIFILTYASPVNALSLDEAVSIAIHNNPSLLQSLKNINSAEEQFKIAKGKKNFSVSASGGFDTSKNEGSNLSESANARLSVSLPLYSGKLLESNISAADLYIKICEMDFAQSADNLTYQVVIAYINALENRATLLVDIETRDNLSNHEQLIYDLFTAGAKAKIDLLRAQVETSNAHQNVIKSQTAYDVALNELASLLSINHIDDIDDVTDVELVNNSFGDVELLISTAFSNRFDIQADNLKIERGEFQLLSAKSGWLPSINASASTGFNAKNDRWDPTSNATAGVTVNWSVFDNDITRAEVDSAKIDIEKLKLALQNDCNNARKEIISAYKNLESAKVRQSTTQAAVELAIEERFIATERYKAGEGILLDVLDSEVSLTTAKKNHLSAKYDVLRFVFALKHALGNTMR